MAPISQIRIGDRLRKTEMERGALWRTASAKSACSTPTAVAGLHRRRACQKLGHSYIAISFQFADQHLPVRHGIE